MNAFSERERIKPIKSKMFILALFVLFVFSSLVTARMRELPKSFTIGRKTLVKVEQKVMPVVDTSKLFKEASRREADRTKPVPYRFATPIDVTLNLENSGTWEELPDGSRLWRLQIMSNGAKSINLGITRFDLPEGAKLWIYNPGGDHVEGPYMARHKNKKGELWTPIIHGDRIIVELYVPVGAGKNPVVEIGKVNHAFRSFSRGEKSLAEKAHGACNIDVVCPEGDEWRDIIRSVACYTLNGLETCSGTLLNNTAGDFTPYFLTACHCDVDAGNAGTMVIYWNYESPNCGDRSGGSKADTQMGATFRAKWADSDFALVELDDMPDAAFNVYYSGWDAAGSIPNPTVCIHHPRVEEKSISFDNDPPISSPYEPVPTETELNHWKIGEWEVGTTEPGSSGSGLWDTTTHRLVGQLHGGWAACSGNNPNASADYYGKLSVSWNGGGAADTRLRDWLDPVGGGTTRQMDGIRPDRDPVDIVLVLDISGSMGDPAQPGGRDKIEVLREAVEIFLRTWLLFATPDDRVEVVFFNSSVDPGISGFNLQPLAGNVDNLILEVGGRNPGGCTAMGSGLKVALKGLEATPNRSHPAILLFTNGIQNVNPMVEEVEDHYEIRNRPGPFPRFSCSSHPPASPEDPGTTLASYEIPIHVIAIGEVEGTSYHDLLDGIRSNTGGLIHVTQNPEVHLREFYLHQLVEALNLGTLEMVDYKHGTLLSGQTMNERFAMDGAIKKAAFLVHWVGEGFPKITIKGPGPGNPELEPTGWIKEKFYNIAYFDFPYSLNGRRISPVGNWTITTKPSNKTIPYQATLLVDETDVHYNFNFSQKLYWTGDPIIVTAKITESGRTIRNLTSVKADLTYPKTALGTLLSVKPGTPLSQLTDLHSTRGYSKLLKLLENPLIRKMIEPETTTLYLFDDGKVENGDDQAGDGIYSAKVKKSNIPGVYKFAFDVEGETLTGWPIKRTQIRSALVHVKPDKNKTRKTARWKDDAGGGPGTALVTVIPYDKFENYLGPDYGNTFRFKTSYGKLKDPIYDALDGSYEFNLYLPDRSKDPVIDISVRGFNVYHDRLSELFKPPERFGLSAHAGYAFPAGNFNLLYDPGLSFGGDLEILLNNSFSLEALFGYHTFKSKILPKTYWMNFSGNLKYFLNTRRLRPFVNGGGGAYKTKNNSKLYFGLNVGGGLSFQLKPTFYIESAYNYHNVFVNSGDNGNIRFSTVQLGLRLRF